MNSNIVDENGLIGSILPRWFADTQTPIDLEIGSATGRFLCRIAQRARDARFIGIEVNRISCLRAADLARKSQLANIIFVSMDAKTFLAEYVPSNIIKEVHIYFPSPYPKNLRTIDKTFVNHVYRVLRLDGTARIITDHQEYFDQISACFNSTHWQHITWSTIRGARSDGLLVDTPAETRYGSRYVLQVLK